MKILDSQSISPIVSSVYKLLVDKTMFEKVRHDKNNRLILGGVGFFFQEKDGDYFICYDKHPKFWNETFIKEDIEAIEKSMLKAQGVYIED